MQPNSDMLPEVAPLNGAAAPVPVQNGTANGTPAFDEVKQGAPCTNSSFFDDSSLRGDDGNLGVGVNAWTSCFGIMRAYYQWQLPTVIWGAHVSNINTEVDINETYSATCDTTAKSCEMNNIAN